MFRHINGEALSNFLLLVSVHFYYLESLRHQRHFKICFIFMCICTHGYGMHTGAYRNQKGHWIHWSLSYRGL